VTLKNVGGKMVDATSDSYSYALKRTNYFGEESPKNGSVQITNLTSLAKNETLEITINTTIELKNTDKSYELIFNDASSTNKLRESDYDNNKLQITNIYFEDVDLSLGANTIFYNTNNPGNVEVQSPHTFDTSKKYGHQFNIKNNSAFRFYGDLYVSVSGTPFTDRGKNNFKLNTRQLVLNPGKSSGQLFAVKHTAPTSGNYNVIFSIDNYDRVYSNNSVIKTMIIN
jgi:hypothetical protein